MPKPLQRESESSNDSSPLSDRSGLDRRLSAKHRLVRSTLFTETFAQQKRWVGRNMILWIRSGDEAALRLGVITSKKVSLRANKRNRVRRRLREAFRNLRPYLSGDVDVLLVGRRAMIDATWAEIVDEMLQLSRRAGLISSEKAEQARQELVPH